MTATTTPAAPAIRRHISGQDRPDPRGWLHAAAYPLSLVAGTVLIALAGSATARTAAWAYAVPSWLLFAVSATYHLGNWSPRTHLLLKRLDHANIYLFIAVTYTPSVLLGLRGALEISMVAAVWTAAAAGVAFRVLRPKAPRWLYVGLYILTPCAPLPVIPTLLHRIGPLVLALIVAGALLYVAGGLVYGLRRPDPAPLWFGFHELFHSLTLAGYATHYLAVSLVIYRR